MEKMYIPEKKKVKFTANKYKWEKCTANKTRVWKRQSPNGVESIKYQQKRIWEVNKF